MKWYPKNSLIFLHQIKIAFLLIMLFCIAIVWIWIEASTTSKRNTAKIDCNVEDLRYKRALDELVSNVINLRMKNFE